MACSLFLLSGSFAQNPNGSFDLSVVRPAKENPYRPVGIYVYPGGRLQAYQVSVKTLIVKAFGVSPRQIKSSISWIDKDLYDVTVTPPSSSAPQLVTPKFLDSEASLTDEQKAMLLSMLSVRFNMHFRVVKENLPVIYLETSTKGRFLYKSEHPEDMPVLIISADGKGSIFASNITMDRLASRLSRYFEEQVINHTELNDRYSFDVKQSPTSSEDGPSFGVLNGLRDSLSQVGLKLVSSKKIQMVIVIDELSRPDQN